MGLNLTCVREDDIAFGVIVRIWLKGAVMRLLCAAAAYRDRMM